MCPFEGNQSLFLQGFLQIKELRSDDYFWQFEHLWFVHPLSLSWAYSSSKWLTASKIFTNFVLNWGFQEFSASKHSVFIWTEFIGFNNKQEILKLVNSCHEQLISWAFFDISTFEVKGQLISKGLFGVIVSTKKPTKYF